MEDVQTSFDKILTLIAKEADPLVNEEEDDGVAQDILEKFAPWKFDKKLVLLEEPDGTVAPSKMNLKFGDFWVQIRNVPLLKMTKKLARSIGDRIGKCIDISRCEGGEVVGGFMRIRVRIDIAKPLWRGLRITFPGGLQLCAKATEKGYRSSIWKIPYPKRLWSCPILK
ncbi:unnamed protein product [Prunus armeniaca]